MFILSNDKRAISNTEHMNAIFIGSDELSIKADYTNGHGNMLGRYQSQTECKVVLEMIAEAIGKTDLFEMPSSETVRTKLMQQSENRQRHITGKKTKGHGGS